MELEHTAKPFLKWAGGKTQLISTIEKELPNNFDKQAYTYIEPFVGSGAMLFWMLNKFPNIKRAVINDINGDLINSYNTIKNGVDKLIYTLNSWQEEYYQISVDTELKKEYYYEKRKLFNLRTSDNVTQTALFIFLNRTCFNGLYRVNSKNEFNVPIGSYKKPMICDETNLRAVNQLLQNVTILNADYAYTLKFAEKNTLFYFDPPYKPLSKTSSFNSYSKDEFNDDEQIRLANFCHQLDELDHDWILSNSDVKGKNPDDDFFDELYSKYNIKRVMARRSINANPEKRGVLTELLITN
jgi:DNA adenine methylase